MTWDNPVMYLKYGRDLARKGDYKRALMFMDEVSNGSYARQGIWSKVPRL